MTLRKSAPRAAQRWGLLAVVVAGLTLALAAVALAVHDLDFQLDGDVLATSTTTVGGNTQHLDWDSFFDANGVEKALPNTDWQASGFDRDFNTNANGSFNTSDNTTFATGSKDTLPITPGWQCNVDNNVLSKNDIMNAYAASYEDPITGDEILYFALERNANTGTANVAFWFLQDDNVNCISPGGSVPFTGDHVDGDILIVSEFTNGGVVNTIKAYQWEGGATGSLNPTAVAEGVDCATTAGLDTICGRVNQGTISTPWLTSNKQDGPGNSLRISEFFEGGINLTEEGLGGRCFNVFMADTRSSTSLTATLFDFSRGQLGQCISTTVTTPRDNAGNPIPAAGLSIGTTARVAVHDTALLTVDGVDSYGGTVTFSLCGPLALTSTSNCATGGVQIGSPVAVAGTSPETVTGPTATLTSAGRYCWRAVYSGDPDTGVPGSSDPLPGGILINECFKINPVNPTLTTTASADVVLGNPISDTASLTGTAKQPGTDGAGPGGTINATAATQAPAGGTISWTLRGPGDCDDAGLPLTGTPRTVSGDNTSYGPVSATPTEIGTYTFVATYSGNSPNTNGAAGACPPGANDGDEVVTVTGVATLATRQRWLPNDAAQITSPAGTTLSGNVVFTLYNDGSCGTGSGTAQYSQTIDVTSGTGSANSRNVTTSNSTFHVTANNDGVAWSWKVSYNDANLGDPDDECETTTPAFTLTD